MSRITLPLCLLLLMHGFARADAPATPPTTQPIVVTGTLGKPENAARIAAPVGRRGVLFVRSEARWDELNTLLPGLTPDTPLPKVDFAKQSIVLVYDAYRHRTDTFTFSKADLATNPPQLNFLLVWDNRGEALRYVKFILAVIPATPSVKVTLTSTPMNADRNLPITEFSATLGGQDGGDIVDGLQAAITPKAATIKPGEDILIDFALHLAKMPDAQPKQFGPAPDTVLVWDGTYSNGYRNHGFFVTTPDGKTTLLQSKKIDAWDDNKPHPVAITAKEPYHLPNGSDNLKSLKALGLDTTAPGTYTITGLYEEIAETRIAAKESKLAPDGHQVSLWGGSIISNTITVEVKP